MRCLVLPVWKISARWCRIGPLGPILHHSPIVFTNKERAFGRVSQLMHSRVHEPSDGSLIFKRMSRFACSVENLRRPKGAQIVLLSCLRLQTFLKPKGTTERHALFDFNVASGKAHGAFAKNYLTAIRITWIEKMGGMKMVGKDYLPEGVKSDMNRRVKCVRKVCTNSHITY